MTIKWNFAVKSFPQTGPDECAAYQRSLYLQNRRVQWSRLRIKQTAHTQVVLPAQKIARMDATS